MFKGKTKRVYSVLVISLVLLAVVSLAGFAKASDSDQGIVDKIVSMYMEYKLQKGDAVLGYSDRPGEVLVKKLVDMDDITTTGADITNDMTGDFVVENVYFETNSKAIASGTLFQIAVSGDTYGTNTPVFSAALSNINVDSAYDLNTSSTYASSTQRAILEDGSKLIVKCTGADCKRSTPGTGTGYIYFVSVLKRADTYSYTFE